MESTSEPLCLSDSSSSLLYYTAEDSQENLCDQTEKSCVTDSGQGSIEDSLVRRLKSVRFADADEEVLSPMPLHPNMTSTPIVQRGILKKPYKQIQCTVTLLPVVQKTDASKSITEKIRCKFQNWYQSDYSMTTKKNVSVDIPISVDKYSQVAIDKAEKMYRERYGYLFPPPSKRIGLRL